MLQGIVDVRSQPGSGGPDVPCDAISLGVEFTGYRVRFAGLADGRPLRNLCEEMMRDGGADDGGAADAGADDAGAADAGSPDAGVPDGGPAEAGAPDAAADG
jgi:hypothetical protein